MKLLQIANIMSIQFRQYVKPAHVHKTVPGTIILLAWMCHGYRGIFPAGPAELAPVLKRLPRVHFWLNLPQPEVTLEKLSS